MPSADVLAQIAAIIAGLTGLFTAIASALTHRNVNEAKATALDTNAKIQTSNGSTIGEIASKADDVAEALVNRSKPTTGA